MSKQIDQVVASLRAFIRAECGDGDQLPPEPVLATQFRVSRATIREAVTRLVIDGVIEKRWGVGTFVLEATPSQGFGLLSFRPGVVASLAVLGGTVTLPHSVTRWAGPDGTRFPDFPTDDTLSVERVYAVDDRPAMFLRDRMVASHDGRRLELDEPDWMKLLIPDLVETIGLTFVHLQMQLTSRPPTPDEQRHLAVSADHPVLVTSGVALDDRGRGVLTVESAVNTDVVQPVVSSTIASPNAPTRTALDNANQPDRSTS